MTKLRHHPIPRLRPARGVTMLEVLVTLLIITLWLLGTAGAQSSAVKLTKAAQFRTTAVLLASDIAERMEGNSAAAAAGAYGPYDSTSYAESTVNCVQNPCSGPNLAAFDLTEWGKRVKEAATLPGATATIGFAPGSATTPATYTITINWADRGDFRATAKTDAEQLTYTATRAINPG